MTKQNHKTGFLVAAMVFSAITLRVLGKFDILIVPGGIARSLIYIALYIGWGISVSKRIIQVQVRHYLIAVSGLMVFWFVIRSMKYYFITDIGIARQLWYWYYLPMLFIPLFSLFVAISLGKPENARLSKTALLLLYIPTVLCLLLVLTNDLHQLAFSFPEGEVWTDKNNGYTFGYYIVLGWEILCAFAAFVIMLIKCRLSYRKKYLPFLLLACSIVYAFIYVSGVEWMQLIGGDITAAQCLMFTGILESCIQCGLIQTNTGYEELFMVSRLGAQITDQGNTVCLASSNAGGLTDEQRMSAKTHPVLADKTTLIKSKPIRFGHVLWQEDVSELTEAIEQIEENCRDLSERNRLRQENLETKKKILSLQEKNRAADVLNRETAGQISMIEHLLTQYDTENDAKKREKLLAGAAVLGAYIKRYGNLLLVSHREETADIRDLSRCFEDSFVNLELLDVKCLCTLPADVILATKDMLRIYHAFETILEDCLFDLHSVWVNARERKGQFLVSIDFVCDTDLSGHKADADLYSCEDGTCRFTFQFQKGGEGA
jgi:hypothetical protein